MKLNEQSGSPVFVRWTDYLTDTSCTLRVSYSDAEATLEGLIERYLTVRDPARLVRNRNLLAESVPEFLRLQDLVLTLADNGDTVGVVPGSAFTSAMRPLTTGAVPPRTPARLAGDAVTLIDVVIDRSDTGYVRNWAGFNRRRLERCGKHVEKFVSGAIGRTGANDADQVLFDSSHEARLEFLRRVGKAIWDSPFENYSRFTSDRLRYKTGDEALKNIIDGRGAICSEKVQALKFVTDMYEFESHYVFAGPDASGPLPVYDLRRILDTFDFRGAAPTMRYWQHMALEYVVDGQHILVDATNGNIPFLFVTGAELDRMLDPVSPQPMSVRMGTYTERFYYHRAPSELALDLCYAMENLVPEIDLVQVFDNELGLVITPKFLITPLPYRSESEFDELTTLYEGLTEAEGLALELDREWGLKGPLGVEFGAMEPDAAELVLESHSHLVERYDRFEGPDHQMGLGVIRLRGQDG